MSDRVSLWRLARGAFLPVLVALAALTAGPAFAQVCQDKLVMTDQVRAAWFNPHVDRATDFELPMPGGLKLVFTRVDLPGAGLYGDERRVFKMGADTPKLYETPLDVRISSPILRGTTALLLMGKYEITHAQFAMMMGNGDMARGLTVLGKVTKDPDFAVYTKAYLDAKDPCYKVMYPDLHEYLSTPLSFLQYKDYVDFIETFNEFCIQRKDCQEILSSLGKVKNYPGFVRLPWEHEWEFVARGGAALAKGDITLRQFQGDLPYFPVGKKLIDFAHLDRDPDRLLPIGSREELFGFYDVLGNARELMQTSFTLENGYGAVGGYSARGGTYQLKLDEVRVSMREELPIFRYDDDDKKFVSQYFPYTGLRLVVGLPIAAIGSAAELQTMFAGGFQILEETGDGAGNTLADARDLGRFAEKDLTFRRDEVGGDDPDDYLSFEITAFVDATVLIEAGGQLQAEVLSEGQGVLAQQSFAGNKQTKTLTARGLLPGRYYVRLSSKSPRDGVMYGGSLKTKQVADTGLNQIKDAKSFQALSAKPVTMSGYVGQGDKHDNHPFVFTADDEGVVLAVKDILVPVTLEVLDDQGRIKGKLVVNPDEPEALKIPFKRGEKGFLHITTDGAASTVYTLSLSAGRITNAEFRKTLVDARSGPTLTAGKTYSGLLNTSQSKLFASFRISTPRKVRVELGGLTGDIDLTVQGTDGKEISSTHRKSGTAAEIFEVTLPAGQYFVIINLKSGNKAGSSNFDVTFATGEPDQNAGSAAEATRATAFQLYINSSEQRKGEVMAPTERTKYYKFNTSTTSMVELYVYNFTAESDLNLTLEDSTGKVIKRSLNLNDEYEYVLQSLSPGTYYIRVDAAGAKPGTGFAISYVALTRAVDPEVPTSRSFVEQNGDWKVYRDGSRCVMVAIAKEIAPESGWLRIKPSFEISVEPGDDSIIIDVGNVSAFASATASGVSGSVLSGGRWNTIRISVGSDSWMKPYDSTNEHIASSSMALFRQGTDLKISGPKAGGGNGYYVFGLSGYTKSAKKINSLCRADAAWILG